ncbi:hypothetical protein DDE82_000194 [Stemphylium lycopersici]|uniref:Uncharacterized protein n=1 Tax=Stemphylium lycopersici TaxID=183478 RepID=A0A364N5X0_STELY|nr:hypothetical protein DDE82_000194 [Stemphylium lycopersici]RAR12632.1 hypothetical protein DDE83_004029 [Stemphylium lycopersici]
MPLFSSKREPSPPPAPAPTHTPSQKSSLFSRRRSTSPVAPSHTSSTHHSSHHRHSSSISRSGTTTSHSTSASSPSGRTSGFFSRNNVSGDPSILNAKQSLANAEQAEREADRALAVARSAVREAREHVARLEREAAEEARLAKIKQGEAKALGFLWVGACIIPFIHFSTLTLSSMPLDAVLAVRAELWVRGCFGAIYIMACPKLLTPYGKGTDIAKALQISHWGPMCKMCFDPISVAVWNSVVPLYLSRDH